ncbi:MAG: BatD family protein [Candidatus Scalindua sp.]
MNKIIRYGIFIIIVLVYAEYTYAARKTLEEEDSKPRVNANVDKAKVTIGDKINYKITVDFPEGIEILLPEIKDEVGEFAVKDSGIEESRNEEGRVTREIWYILETFNTGSYIIPAFDIKYKTKPESEEATVKTPEVFIEVLTTLDENASDIRDIKPPVTINKNYFRLYIIIAIVFGVLVFAAAVILFLQRRKQKEIEFVPEPLPAYQIAYNELENLRTLNLISEGRIKEYYYRLSNIVRRYIENRFKLMAPERTTEEFLAEMTVTDRLAEVHKTLISHFLEHCDMVKFAAYGPCSREIENAFDSAIKLVDETKEVSEKELSTH